MNGNTYHVLPLASASDRIVYFKVLFPIYTLLMIHLSPKEINQHQAQGITILNVH
jgi:hypothetical protein